MASEQTTPPSRRTLRFGMPLTLALFAAAAAVSYFGTASRERKRPEVANPPAKREPGSPVVSITLPYEEPDLPPGPHLREFQVACTTCHSTRLVLTQPAFPKAKWEATVKKMVDTYGAPIGREEQAKTVDYLVAIRGK
jgi:cytochrome c5